MDGLGGLPHPLTGLTELESAHVPHMDALAARSSLGMAVMVREGITPGSGPGHLSLFGYDPTRYVIGRGALSALGVGGFALLWALTTTDWVTSVKLTTCLSRSVLVVGIR